MSEQVSPAEQQRAAATELWKKMDSKSRQITNYTIEQIRSKKLINFTVEELIDTQTVSILPRDKRDQVRNLCNDAVKYLAMRGFLKKEDDGYVKGEQDLLVVKEAPGKKEKLKKRNRLSPLINAAFAKGGTKLSDLLGVNKEKKAERQIEKEESAARKRQEAEAKRQREKTAQNRKKEVAFTQELTRLIQINSIPLRQQELANLLVKDRVPNLAMFENACGILQVGETIDVIALALVPGDNRYFGLEERNNGIIEYLHTQNHTLDDLKQKVGALRSGS